MTGRTILLAGGHTRYCVLRLVRAGMGLTVLCALGAVALMVTLLANSDLLSSPPELAAAVLAVALIATMVSALVHTVLVADESSRPGWVRYVGTLPGRHGTRTMGMLVAACLVGMLAALPVTALGLLQGVELEVGRWTWALLLMPVSALPGALLGLLVARIRPIRGRQVGTVAALLVLVVGALVTVGGMPGWAQALSSVTPTSAASHVLAPVITGGPIPAVDVALWTAWCLILLCLLLTLERPHLRSQS